jgi:hypothetical protein
MSLNQGGFMKLLFAMLLVLMSSSAFAKFLPDSILKNAPKAKTSSPMTKQEFDAIINNIQNTFSPIVTFHGGKLAVSGDWASETLNAGANQTFGSWKVVITGGLARRPELTADGFTLILCHELGHHLAGFPFGGGNPLGGSWAANEGQADYYATHYCARKLWSGEKQQNEKFRSTASAQILKECDSQYLNYNEQNLCYRTLVGAESVAATMAALMKKPMPKYETPDPAVVKRTSNDHPDVQCRMDTSLRGALCKANFDEKVIPGKKVSGGVDSVNAETESAFYTCMKHSGFEIGLRPLCWFAPRM